MSIPKASATRRAVPGIAVAPFLATDLWCDVHTGAGAGRSHWYKKLFPIPHCCLSVGDFLPAPGIINEAIDAWRAAALCVKLWYPPIRDDLRKLARSCSRSCAMRIEVSSPRREASGIESGSGRSQRAVYAESTQRPLISYSRARMTLSTGLTPWRVCSCRMARSRMSLNSQRVARLRMDVHSSSVPALHAPQLLVGLCELKVSKGVIVVLTRGTGSRAVAQSRQRTFPRTGAGCRRRNLLLLRRWVGGG